MDKQVVFFAVATGVLALLLTVGPSRAYPVPAKILGKYVLSYQPPGPRHNLDPHGDPEDELDELSNGLESGESGGEPISQGSSHHYRYRPQYQEPLRQQYDDREHEQDDADYADDAATASANHQHHYMTTYKTATRHGGGTRGHTGYSGSDSDEEEAEEEDTSASEESNSYDAFRAYKGRNKKQPGQRSPGTGSTHSVDHDESRQNQHHHQHHQQQQHHHHQLQQQQQQQQQRYHGPAAHTSYHPQLIQAYKILHGTPSRLPTSHEYVDDNGSDEQEDEDFRSGAAIGAAGGPSGYGDYGPQVVHTRGRAIPISQHVEIETPVPVPYVKKIHVPIPQEVRVKIPHPVLVPIPRPYPVHIPVSQPIAVPDIKEITVPIEKVVPYPVEKKIPVPIERPVPYPVEKHVPVYLPQPIPVKVPIVKTIIHKVKQQTASGPPLPPGSGSFW